LNVEHARLETLLEGMRVAYCVRHFRFIELLMNVNKLVFRFFIGTVLFIINRKHCGYVTITDSLFPVPPTLKHKASVQRCFTSVS
jgi:hypothetical protein